MEPKVLSMFEPSSSDEESLSSLMLDGKNPCECYGKPCDCDRSGCYTHIPPPSCETK